MKVSRSAAIALFGALGIHSMNEKTPNKVLQTRLDNMKQVLEDVSQDTFNDLDETNKSLLEDIVKAATKGQGIKVIDDDTPPTHAKEKKAPATRAKGKVAKAVEDDEEDDEDTEESEPVKVKAKPKKAEDEEEEEEEAPAGKKKAPIRTVKAPTGRTSFERVGVVAAIAACLEGTSKSKPVTAKDVLNHLCKKFPKRDAKGMKHTVDVQLNYPKYSSLMKKGMNIVKTDDKEYYLGKKSKEASPESNGTAPAAHKPAAKGKVKEVEKEKPAVKEKEKVKVKAKKKVAAKK